jgi:signal transduction histidine kinase
VRARPSGLSRRIGRLHGGDLGLAPHTPGGATFVVTLPLGIDEGA